jgi:uncharacterized membrane protein YgaE (UPF0421/DUF939 family)
MGVLNIFYKLSPVVERSTAHLFLGISVLILVLLIWNFSLDNFVKFAVGIVVSALAVMLALTTEVKAYRYADAMGYDEVYNQNYQQGPPQ